MRKSPADLPRAAAGPIPKGAPTDRGSFLRADQPADFFETQLADGRHLGIAYSAVRQLRASEDAGVGHAGLLWGSDSVKGVQIERCELFRAPLGKPVNDRARLHAAVRGFCQRESEGIDDLNGSPVGIFRTQAGSWASSTDSDAELLEAFLTEMQANWCFFLLIRKFDYRPWSANVFIAHAGGTATEVLEFPFDDYLLINGYTDLNPPPPPEPEQPQPKRVLQRKILGVAAAAALAAGIAIYAWFPKRPASTDGYNAASLGLEIHKKGGDYEVSWNRLSGIIRTASGGTLSIRDTGVTQTLQLSAEQLREGSVVYSSLTEDVDFRLEIQASDQNPRAESVQVFGWKPSPELRSTAPQDGGAGAQVPPIASSAFKAPTEPPGIVVPLGGARSPLASSPPSAKPIPVAPSSSLPVVKEQQASKVDPPPRQFMPPSQRTRTTEAAPVVLPEPPNPLPSGAVLPQNTVFPQTLARIPASPPAEAPTVRQIKVGGNVQASKLLKQVQPVYSPVARAARIQGVVRFQATIGKDGRILNLQLVSGSPLLTKSASDAVSQWVYRPTLLNGEPVEVVTQIDVNFSLEH